jgi:hypothetical protein
MLQIDALLEQADHCLRRAARTSDIQLAARLVEMAEESMRRAEAIAHETTAAAETMPGRKDGAALAARSPRLTWH